MALAPPPAAPLPPAPSPAASLPDDHILTESNWVSASTSISASSGEPQLADPHRILLIACGALAHEVLALIRLNGWQHLDLQCLPANLHLWPDRIPAAVEAAVIENRSRYAQIFIVYADCGTGGLLFEKCKELAVEMIEGPHCYSFFEGNQTFAAKAETEFTAFYLTDFLVRQFDAFVWRPMGLDRHPQLREMLFGNYTKLIYQAQTDDPALNLKAQDCARRLNLAYERRFTGYGELASRLAQVALGAAKA